MERKSSPFSFTIKNLNESSKLPPNYPNLISGEVKRWERGGKVIRVFAGAPLSLKAKPQLHLYPIEGKDKEGLLNFDLITGPNKSFPLKSFFLDLRLDDELKLGLSFPNLFSYDRANTGICRINPNQIYFPLFPERRSKKKPAVEVFKERVIKLLLSLSENIIWPSDEEISRFINWYFITPEETKTIGDFQLRKRQVGSYLVWDVFPEEIILRRDAFSFPFFQVFFPDEKESFEKIRIDSGCQIGQIYDDQGCDCRWQFQNALKNGATIIHFPFQDGRGFGMATKLATERIKHKGIDTVEAAKEFFGSDNFDIRNYSLAGKFLSHLGVRETILTTDNKQKVQALEESGIKVKRLPTNSLDNCPHARKHIEAKHATSNYYQD